jgi:hypothetical protein
MRLLEDMDRRLQNWSRYVWMMHSGGRVAGGGALEERVDGDGWDAPTVVPTDDNEAEETNAGVLALPGALRAAVEVWYLGAGGVKAKAQRLCVSETTLRERVGLAHRHLGQWLADKALAARRQRERIEALQASARAAG